MCDFKPGDEVVCVVPGDWRVQAPKWMFWRRSVRSALGGPRKGDVDIVVSTGLSHHLDSGRELVMLVLRGWPGQWFNAECFRKIQRRDLTAWLATENTINEPTRAPAMEPA